MYRLLLNHITLLLNVNFSIKNGYLCVYIKKNYLLLNNKHAFYISSCLVICCFFHVLPRSVGSRNPTAFMWVWHIFHLQSVDELNPTVWWVAQTYKQACLCFNVWRWIFGIFSFMHIDFIYAYISGLRIYRIFRMSSCWYSKSVLFCLPFLTYTVCNIDNTRRGSDVFYWEITIIQFHKNVVFVTII